MLFQLDVRFVAIAAIVCMAIVLPVICTLKEEEGKEEETEVKMGKEEKDIVIERVQLNWLGLQGRSQRTTVSTLSKGKEEEENEEEENGDYLYAVKGRRQGPQLPQRGP